MRQNPMLICLLSLLLTFVGANAADGDNSSTQPHKRTPTIAVLPFSDANPGSALQGLGHVVSAMMGTHLRNETNFIVLERSSLLRVLDEKQYEDIGLTKETRDKLRQMLAVEVLLTGEVSSLAGQIQIDLRLISVLTGEVVVADFATVNGSDNLRPAVSKLAKALEDRYLRQWMGNLTVLVHPVEGEVYLDGQFVGKASTNVPLKLPGILEGDYKIKVLAGGYQPLEQAISIQARTTRELQLGLKSLPGSLEIFSEPLGATVWLNSHAMGVTPLKLDTLAEGSYLIQMALVNFKNWSQKVMINSGQASEVKAKLAVVQGSMLVESQPAGASVYIAGNLVGKAPLLLENVPPGVSVVSLRLDGYTSWSGEINVQPGEKVKLSQQLDRQYGKLTVVSVMDDIKAELLDREGNIILKLLDLPTHKLPVDEGEYVLRVSKNQYFTQDYPVRIAPDEEFRIEVVLKRKPGKISIAQAAQTPVDVFVDGNYLGKAGGLAVELPEGKHRVFLRNYHGEKSMVVTIVADQTVEIPASSLQVQRGLPWWSALGALLLSAAILTAAEVNK